MRIEYTRELVERKVREGFGGEAGRAMEILRRYGAEPWQRERERVQVAVVKLAEGDLGRLEELVSGACEDYRSILMGAEFPREAGAKLRMPAEEREALRRADREAYEGWVGEG